MDDMTPNTPPPLKSTNEAIPGLDSPDTGAFDDVFEGPGFTIARKGRFLFQQSHLSPEEHKAMQEKLIAGKPDLLTSINHTIETLEHILFKHHPLDMLANLALANSIIDCDTYKESTFQGSDAYVEYVSLLYLRRPPESLKRTTEKVIDGRVIKEIQALLEKLYVEEAWFLMIQDLETLGGRQPDVWHQLRFKTILTSLRVRYPAYQHHLRDQVRGIAGNLACELLAILGFTIEDALALADAVSTLWTKRLIGQRRQAVAFEKRLRKAVEKYRKKKQVSCDVPLEFVEKLKGVRPRDLNPLLRNLGIAATFHRLGDAFSFSAEELASEAKVQPGRAQAFLTHFSLTFGSVVDERYRRPAPTHPLMMKPFVLCDERYFCPVPRMIEWSLRPAIEAFLKPDSPDRITDEPRFWEKYEKERSFFLESTALVCFGRALRHAQIHSGLKYKTMRDDGTTYEAELDGLILFDTVAFLIEGKAGSLSPPARRGGRARMRDEMKELVEKAYTQGLRAKRFIENTAQPVFTLEDGQQVSIDKNHLDHVILVAVTLESLDVFVTNVYLLKDAGFFGAGDIPWVVSLADLQVISELVEFPSQVVHYLFRRRRINELGKIMAHDELDWFGHYLAEGLFFDDFFAEGSGPDILQLLNYSSTFDDHYMYTTGQRRIPAEVPRQSMPPVFRKLLQSLEDYHPQGYVRAMCALLDMASEDRNKFSESITTLISVTRGDGNLHDFTMVFSTSSTGVTCMFAPNNKAEELQRKLPTYCQMKKYQTKTERWIGIGILVDVPGSLHALITVHEAWQHDPRLEEIVSKCLKPLPQ
jgi:hypothetical protein